MHFLNYNGKIIDSTSAVALADDWSLRYGYGLFETLKLIGDDILLWKDHADRLWEGFRVLKIKLPAHFSPEKLQKETIALARKNKLNQARVRITVTYGNGGLYDGTEALNYIIECNGMSPRKEILNSNGLELSVYREALKPIDIFCNIKHNNFLLYASAAREAKGLRCNDSIILNQHGRLCENTIGNIFLIKDGIIFTPPLDEGCIAGTMRKYLLKNLPALEFNVQEKPLQLRDLWEADEVFTSNSVYGIRYVGMIEKHHYQQEKITQIAKKLYEKDVSLFL